MTPEAQFRIELAHARVYRELWVLWLEHYSIEHGTDQFNSTDHQSALKIINSLGDLIESLGRAAEQTERWDRALETLKVEMAVAYNAGYDWGFMRRHVMRLLPAQEIQDVL